MPQKQKVQREWCKGCLSIEFISHNQPHVEIVCLNHPYAPFVIHICVNISSPSSAIISAKPSTSKWLQKVILWSITTCLHNSWKYFQNLCPNMLALMLDHQTYSRFGLKMHKLPLPSFVWNDANSIHLKKMLNYNQHVLITMNIWTQWPSKMQWYEITC